MISFIKGIVYEINNEFVIIENAGIGYKILMSKTDNLSLNEEEMIHTYQHVREDDISLFGFESIDAREIFLKLISVKGIGPKTANNILAKAEVAELVSAIENKNIKYLKTLPGIGAKSAQQIILDLQNKLKIEEEKSINPKLDDAIEGLKSLGYNSSELKSVKTQLSKKVMETNDYLKAGLNILNKRKGR